ncbi:hypothetical protein KAU11_12475 [Candidatus Babeliales bacterium]|nr:hypothetical protein [Candidatus Babeliales bacterium]
MNKTVKMLSSALINGAIAGGGAFLALVANLSTGQTVESIGTAALVIAAGTGIMTALKDIQAFLTNSGDM